MLPQELLDFLVPACCAGCGTPHRQVLCPRCHAALPWLETPASSPHPPSLLRRTVAAVAFSGEARNWIHRFKYPGRGISRRDPEAMAVVRMLARTAAYHASDLPPKHIVAIPVHRKRFRQRGFNPAYLVAREISRHQAVDLERGWLTRVRNTTPQYGLDTKSRISNVGNAFECRAQSALEHGRVWLVDDVVTTGATLHEAARALLQAGCREVVGVCLARTLRPEATSFAGGHLTLDGHLTSHPPIRR